MLYQRVRPKSFIEIVGNKAVVDSLQKLVKEKAEKRPHAFMFHGPSGCGKTTIARILAKELGCEGISLSELNAANTRGLDSVRDIADSALSSPMFGLSKCYIFDESQQLTPAAQQALLKVIEDCPKYAYFMFCTTDPGKIIETIKNRCAKYQVVTLRPSEIRTLLENVIKQEKLSQGQDVVEAIADAAKGCPRQALMLLEQIQDIDPKEVLEYISSAETAKKEVIELIREVVSKRSNRWSNCVKLYQGIDSDPETVRLSILGYLKKVLLGSASVEEAGRAAELISVFERSTYSSGEAGIVKMIFEACLIE